MKPAAKIKKINKLIEESIFNLEVIFSIYWIFGISREEIPNQSKLYYELYKKLEEFKTYYKPIRSGKIPITLDTEESFEDYIDKSFDNYKELHKNTKNIKMQHRNEPFKVKCSDKKLLQVALRIKDEGYVKFDKKELEKILDFSNYFEFWDKVPNYTTITFGGGVLISSPEADLFQSMCWFHDQAFKKNKELRDYRNTILDQEDAEISNYISILGENINL